MKNAAVNPVAFFLTGADPNSATDLTGMSRIPHKASQECLGSRIGHLYSQIYTKTTSEMMPPPSRQSFSS